jgi:hypothetical protein
MRPNRIGGRAEITDQSEVFEYDKDQLRGTRS